MQAQLQNLIDKIKQDGVKEAQKQADEIIKQAKAQASQIAKEANQQKDAILKQAQNQANDFQKASQEALKHAARDTVLSLKSQITELFDKVLKNHIAKHLDADLKNLLLEAVKGFSKQGIADIEVLLNEKDKSGIEKALLSELSAEMRKGVSFKAAAGIDSGFRIGEKGKDYYYDFTQEAVLYALKAHLNPKLASLLDSK
ncbi:MAG: hypothetical protein V2A72_07820 [Candidatus Omnitrophota bacterium]